MKNLKYSKKSKSETCEDDDDFEFEKITPEFEIIQPEVRTLFILGEVSPVTVAMFAGPFAALDSKKGDITVKICSTGGDVGSGLAIYDIIASSKNKVTTEGYGSVQSIASCILQAGSVRKLAENCRFMIHSTLGMFPYPMKSKDVMSEAKEMEYLNSVLCNILKKRSKLTKQDIENMLNQDMYFNAYEALKKGLCDQVIKNKRLPRKFKK